MKSLMDHVFFEWLDIMLNKQVESVQVLGATLKINGNKSYIASDAVRFILRNFSLFGTCTKLNDFTKCN